jgi:hypothetical protein
VLAATPTCGRRRADPYTVAMKRGMHPCPRSVFSWPLGAHGCDVGLAGRNMANSLPGLSPPAAYDGSHRVPVGDRRRHRGTTKSDGSGGSCGYVVHDPCCACVSIPTAAESCRERSDERSCPPNKGWGAALFAQYGSITPFSVLTCWFCSHQHLGFQPPCSYPRGATGRHGTHGSALGLQRTYSQSSVRPTTAVSRTCPCQRA